VIRPAGGRAGRARGVAVDGAQRFESRRRPRPGSRRIQPGSVHRRQSPGRARRPVGRQSEHRGELSHDVLDSAATCSQEAARELLPLQAARSGPAQADSRARPLRRRAPMIPRPARVRMRSRKPWVRARRRLFGWKVRFTSGLHRRRAGSQNRRPPRRAKTHACDLGPSADRPTVRAEIPQGQTGPSQREEAV
jgi:hypothetical protein